jgi:hypothetical protein
VNHVEVRILGLSKLDVESLQRAAGTPLQIEQAADNPKEVRELATLVVIGGIGVVSAAAAYFFGKRRSEEIELDVEARDQGGAFRRVRLRLKRHATDPVDTQIMSQIRAALGQT